MIIEFEDYFKKSTKFYALKVDAIKSKLDRNEIDYMDLKYILLAWRDKQIGIKSTLLLEEVIPNAQTSVLYRRDATQAQAIKKRLSQNAPLFHMIDLMHRSLTTMRAIDHVLIQRKNCYPGDEAIYNEQQKLLKNAFVKLIGELEILQGDSEFLTADEKTKNQFIKQMLDPLEEEFNTTLCFVLHNVNLDRGITSVKMYKKLLNHYRNLGSLLDEAPSVETVAQINHKKITKTSHPITKKTDVQKTILMRQAEIELDQIKYGDNYHTRSKEWQQEANHAFLELMCDDRRRLSAQTRKTHLPTMKNSYIETVDVDGKCITYISSATLAYIGKYETYQARIAAGEENIRQMIQAASEHTELQGRTDLHFQILNTKFLGLENQDIMIDVTEKATNGKLYSAPDVKTHYSNTPVNFLGTFCSNTIDADVAQGMGSDYSKWTTWMPNPGDRATRNQVAINAAYATAKSKKFIQVTACASGRDRTRVIGTGITQKHLEANGVSDANLFEPLTQCNGFTAHLENTSGYGQKSCSNPGLEQYPEQCFLETADKKKQVKLNEKIIKDVTKGHKLEYDYLVDVIARVRKEQRHSYGFFKALFFDSELGNIQKIILTDLVELLIRVHNGEPLPQSITDKLAVKNEITIKDVITAWKEQKVTHKIDEANKKQSNFQWLSQHQNSFFSTYLNSEHTHEVDALMKLEALDVVENHVTIKSN